MKKTGTLLTLFCAGLFAVGCDGQKAEEAKEKLQSAGEHAADALKEGADAVVTGGEAVVEKVKDATSDRHDDHPTTEETHTEPEAN